MSFLPMDDPVFASIGNGAHVVSLISTLLFAGVVARYAADENNTFFDKQWKEEGFCVANKDVPHWNSHDACLYFDTIAAVVLGLVYLGLSKTPGMERANELFFPGIVGIFAHGLGHGHVGKIMREQGNELVEDSQLTGLEYMESKTPVEILQLQAPLLVFWLGLIKASAPNLSSLSIVGLSLASLLGQMFVPQYFGFTYVQTVLMLVQSINQLSRKKQEKDFMYAVNPILVGIPVTLVGWMESTQCTSFVKDKLYGHLVYDGFIPFGMLTWYVVCYLRVSLNEDMPQALKKKEL